MLKLKAMIKFSAQEIESIVHGRLTGMDRLTKDRVRSYLVAMDSREVSEGSLFVAKPGERTDGHLYVNEAFAKGAALALVEHEIYREDGTVFPSIVTEDAVVALGRLAKAHLRKIREAVRAEGGCLKVLGITGSVGKTTVKDLVAHILGTKAATVAPFGSYNGEIGVPLTVCSADERTRFLVIEMGATKPGNISYLCDIVEPDSVAVLNVGTAHVGEFGGRENIAKTKSEIVCDIAESAYAVLNMDDYQVRAMIEHTHGRVLGFSAQYGGFSADLAKNFHPHPAVGSRMIRATEISLDSIGKLRGTLHFPASTIKQYEEAVARDERIQPVSFEIKTALLGRHHIANVLAAAALSYVQGIDAADIAAELENRGAVSKHRMERIAREDGVVVINDAYNASPESMRAALQTLAIIGREARRQGHRTWAVLGAMLELGQDSAIEHDAIGRLAVRLNISRLIVVGEKARAMYIAAVMEGSWSGEAVFAGTMEEAEEILKNELSSGDVVLFKSSNGSGLRLLGDKLARNSSEPQRKTNSPK